MKRCLMLDVDGVLVHSRNGGSWADDIRRDLGIDPEQLSSSFFIPHWPDVIIGRTSLEDALAAALPSLSSVLTIEDFIGYWFERDSMIDEAVLQDVRALKTKGIAVFLATNQEHRRARYLMANVGLKDEVDGIIYSAAIGAKKPSPAFFETAERQSGFGAEEIVFVDDTKANVEAARERGWTAQHWTEGQRLSALLKV